REPVLAQLLWHQEVDGDGQLLGAGVAGYFDHFQAVHQGRGDGGTTVGRGQEHHLGEIERYTQVVVDEGRVLLRVQHLEQREGRVSARVGAHLLDLVQHQHGVLALGLLERPSEVLPTPGGPTNNRMGPRLSLRSWRIALYSTMRFLTVSRP